MNEVYVIAGGEWLRNNLNAIAAFMGTRTWDSIEKIALTLSVLAVAVMWVQRHNVMDLLGWVMALFNHDTSRDQEPQLHTHAVVANVTQHNGEWKTLSSDKVGKTGFIENVYANQIAFGRLYRQCADGHEGCRSEHISLAGGRTATGNHHQ